MSGRLAVHPVSAAALYGSTSPGPAPLSGPADLGAPDAQNLIVATFVSPHGFTTTAAAERVYVVGDPVSFCVNGDRLHRYAGYGLTAVQPGVAALPAGLPDRSLIAAELGPGAVPFTIAEASLERNAMVQIDLTFGTGADALRVQHAVQVRNAP